MAEINDEKPHAGLGKRFIRLLAWTPRWLRWDADLDAHHEITWGLCVLFGVVGFFIFFLLLSLYFLHSTFIFLTVDGLVSLYTLVCSWDEYLDLGGKMRNGGDEVQRLNINSLLSSRLLGPSIFAVSLFFFLSLVPV